MRRSGSASPALARPLLRDVNVKSDVICIELRGRARRHWWRLTTEEAERIEGDREILIGRLQERFGRTREQAAREVEKWFKGDVGRP